LADLRQAYKALLDADAGLEETTEWLKNEDEILQKIPLLEREKIKVSPKPGRLGPRG
jgi:sarcosine oxidase/L-pipecolate oxidase